MDISVQYLEGDAEARNISPAAARTRLQDALERVPFSRVLLGWDLDSRVIEACAETCARHRSELYLWQPLLTGHDRFPGNPDSRVVSLSGGRVAGPLGKAEFTFLCPNRQAVQESVLQCLDEALASSYYHGVFLDRIRFPSPANDFAGKFACFCDACRIVAHEAGLDLGAVQQAVSRLVQTDDGRHAVVSEMLAAFPAPDVAEDISLLRHMLAFREQSISRFVTSAVKLVRGRKLQVGLDCFSPTLARMVGQDLARLADDADWIKVMTYARAFAPASLPYEVVGLAGWLTAGGETEQAELEWLAKATGWALPGSCASIRTGTLPASVLTQEIERGRAVGLHRLLAGIELVEMPEVAHLTTEQIRADARAVRAGGPDGVVFCWDLWRMPAERVELAASLYEADA